MMLFRHHTRSEAVTVVIWAAVLGMTALLTTYLWDTMRSSESLAELEAILASSEGLLKGLMGADLNLTTLDGWVQSYVLGSWMALPYVIFTALYAAGMVARDMDRRTMEFLLSLPVSRAQVLLARWLTLVLALAAVHAVQFVGIAGAVSALGENASLGRYAIALVNSLLLYLCLGTVMLLISLYIDDYGRATGTLLGVGLGLVFFHMATVDADGVLWAVRDVLPFSFYDLSAIIGRGEVPLGDMALLTVATLLALALAVRVFERKQIAV